MFICFPVWAEEEPRSDPVTKKLELPKLNFQIIHRTMATQAQSMGAVKDMQAHLWHAKAGTRANEYMQESPKTVNVKRMVGSVRTMLMNRAGFWRLTTKRLTTKSYQSFRTTCCKR
jgi:hypothetical protein